MHKNQYVVKHGDNWAIRGEHNRKVTKITSTQKEAIELAINIARNQKSELRVQDRNGRFGTCNSYGADHCPPKDKNR